MTSIRFANTKEGFAFDPGLRTTTNGGRTWTQTKTLDGLKQFTVLSLAATSNGTVYALVGQGSPKTGYGGGSLLLLRAAAHSTAFHQVRSIPMPGAPSVVAAGASAYVVSGTGKLLGFGPIGEHSVKLPDFNSDTGCSIAASNASSLLAICSSSVSAGSMGSRTAYGTTDGGKRWTRLPNPGKGAGYVTAGVTETTNGHAVINTYSAGGAGLLSTVNDAQSWRTTLLRSGTGSPTFKDLGFENNLDGSVIYDPVVSGLNVTPKPTGELFRTSDGGASWHHVAY